MIPGPEGVEAGFFTDPAAHLSALKHQRLTFDP